MDEDIVREGPYVRFMSAPQQLSGFFKGEVWVHVDHAGSVAAITNDEEDTDASWLSDGNETYRLRGSPVSIVRALNQARQAYLEEDVP